MNAPDQPIINACPLGCDDPLYPTSIEMPTGRLLGCGGCGQLLGRCTHETYKSWELRFNTSSGTAPDKNAVRRSRKRIGRFLTHIRKTLNVPAEQIRLLDVGCSNGTLLKIAGEMGFNAEGIDPAVHAARAAVKEGLKVRTGVLEDAGFPPGTFDAVTLFEVIEHLRDPLALLGECRKILRENGVLVIGTGNAASWTAGVMGARWEYFRPADHISLFNPRSISLLAQRTGFRVQRIRTKNFRIYEKTDVPRFQYRLGRVISELVRPLTILAGTGHDMLVTLRPA